MSREHVRNFILLLNIAFYTHTIFMTNYVTGPVKPKGCSSNLVLGNSRQSD